MLAADADKSPGVWDPAPLAGFTGHEIERRVSENLARIMERPRK
jgi:hypothetical protein